MPGEGGKMKLLLGHALPQERLDELTAAAPVAELVIAEGREAVLREIPDAEAYVPGPWDDEVVDKGWRLRWVHFMWAGVEGQLTPRALEGSFTITNSAGVFGVPMAEHALAMMLCFARGLHVCLRRSPEQLWHRPGGRRSVTEGMRELAGATLGILGYGGIGRETAQRARAFGMRIVALRRRPERGAQFADVVLGPDGLDELLRESDYLLISCPLTPETRGMIGARELALMKPEAVLVNLARGGIVHEHALVAALREGRIRGAALDVTEQEPLPPDSPLWGMENVLITPHVAGTSPRTSRRQFELLRDNMRRFVAGEPLLNVVDRAAGY